MKKSSCTRGFRCPGLISSRPSTDHFGLLEFSYRRSVKDAARPELITHFCCVRRRTGADIFVSSSSLQHFCQARGSSGRRKHWNEGRDKKSLFLVSVNGNVRCQCCELLLRCLNRYKLYEYVQKDHQLLRKITLRVI